MVDVLTSQTADLMRVPGTQAAPGTATTSETRSALAFYSFARLMHATDLTLDSFIERVKPALEETEFNEGGVKSLPASWRDL